VVSVTVPDEPTLIAPATVMEPPDDAVLVREKADEVPEAEEAFMVTPEVWDDINPHRTPWIFPDGLAKTIHEKVTNVDVLTIAYSVNGGYTPIKYKYLGDELRMLFEDRMDERAKKTARLKRENAIASYEEAIELYDKDASAYFNLSMLYFKQRQDPARARQLYRQAVSLDKTYACADNNYGAIYLKKKRLEEAEKELQRFLELDEDNPNALNGLGFVALRKKQYAQAAQYFDLTLSKDRNNKLAIFGKGVACFKTKLFEEAERLFLKIEELFSPEEPEAYRYLAMAYERKGALQKAMEYYVKTILAGGEWPLVHLALCRVYLKTRFYRRAISELKEFIILSRSYYISKIKNG